MVWDVQTEAIGLLPSPAAGPSGRGIGANGLPEIAEDDVHHGAAPVGAAAARRGLARCADQLFFDFFDPSISDPACNRLQCRIAQHCMQQASGALG